MLDMVEPKEKGRIRLQDLKACSLTPIFFDTFINLDKYLEHEQKDPFSSIRVRYNDSTDNNKCSKSSTILWCLAVCRFVHLGHLSESESSVWYSDECVTDRLLAFTLC